MESKRNLVFETSNLVTMALEKNISSEDFDRLQCLIKTEPEALEIYLELISVYSNLDVVKELDVDSRRDRYNDILSAFAEDAKTAPTVSIQKEKPEQPIQRVEPVMAAKEKVSRRSVFTLMFSAAAMIMLVLLVRFLPNRTGMEVASIVDQVDSVWGNPDSDYEQGSRLWTNDELMNLKKGLVNIEYDEGVDVVVEGPAVFQIKRSGLYLAYGRLFCHVSESGYGFRVETPSSEFVDLGTEFGVKTYFDDVSELHVFKGKLQLFANQSEGNVSQDQIVVENNAMYVDADSSDVRSIPVQKGGFVGKEEFDCIVGSREGDPYSKWLAYSYKLRRDPSLVAYYTFDRDIEHPRKLENKSYRTDGRLNGKLYSAINGELPQWTKGRWSQKTSLNFDRNERQVVIVEQDPELDINGPISIGAWVRCDDPNDGGHILTCRVPGRGAANYQFGYKSPDMPTCKWSGKMQFGRMRFHEAEDLDESDRIYTNQGFSESSEWKFVVVAHDGQKASFYVDGELVEEVAFAYLQEPVKANLVIGADDVEGDPLRFTGEMGELMIFDRILEAKEISEMYKVGRPQQGIGY